MRILKTIITGVTITALALLGACGTGGDATTPGLPKESSQNTQDQAMMSWPDLSGNTLSVAATWSGAEQENFEKVIEAFTEATGATVQYVSFGDNAPAYLAGQIEGGQPPNVALLGQPALMQQFAKAGNIKPLSSEVLNEVKAHYGQSWIDLATVEGQTYGVWFKAANKSTVWYHQELWDQVGASPDNAKDWPGFLSQLKLLSDSGYGGISVGADVGWPLTDWFENVYLRLNGPEKYDQLTNHEIPWTDESVRKTLEYLAQLWDSNLVTPGGAQRDFPTSVNDVFGGDPKAATVFEGDFVSGVITDLGKVKVGEGAKFFDFPAVEGSSPMVVGGGDVAVAFTDDEATQAFMRFLASPESASVWVPLGGLTSPNRDVPLDSYPDPTSRQVAEALTNAETFRFDLSDLTPSAFGGTAGQGFWKEMITFYENPKDIDQTMSRLEAAAVAAYQ